MRIVTTVMLGMVLALPATAHGAAPTLSKLEARAMSREATKRRVLEQLGDVLVEQPRPRRGRRPVRPLSDIWFWTHARTTYRPGLCAADEVIVSFRTVGRGQNAGTPTRAEGLSATTRYRFLAAPHRADEPLNPIAEEAQNRKCARLQPDSQSFFLADDIDQAIEAALVIGELPTVLAGQSPVVACDLGARAQPDECHDLLATLRIDQISAVRGCGGMEPGSGPHSCLAIEADTDKGWYAITVVRTAGEVVRLRVSEQLIVADERID